MLIDRTQEAIRFLRGQLQPNDTVYTVFKHVSRSNKFGVIDVYVVKDNIPIRLSWSAAFAIGASYDTKYDGVRVSGAGMDMGFQVVHRMAHTLFGDEHKLDHQWLSSLPAV